MNSLQIFNVHMSFLTEYQINLLIIMGPNVKKFKPELHLSAIKTMF